jgi:Fur family ferric uptake transcriptional regulator
MSCTPRLTQTLRQRGFRMTPQRLAILQALHAGGHLSPAQVYARVVQTGLTETTVYRTLDFLAENGMLLVSNREKGHLTYELAEGSHHHLVCRLCSAQVDLEPEALQPLLGQLHQHSGYRLDAGHFTFYGLCPVCQKKADR